MGSDLQSGDLLPDERARTSGSPYSSKRLGLAARHSPLVGYGIGSVVDPRSVPDGSNPLYRIPAGVEAIRFRYIFDGNWGLLAVETGFLGVAAVVILLAAIGRVGMRSANEPAGVVVYCLVGCVVLLGFFECILQDAPSTLVWWVFVGLAIAAGDTACRNVSG